MVPSPAPISTTAEQLGQRSSSVDFTVFPGQRRDLQAVSAASRTPTEGSPTPRRAGSIKRNDSVKRSDSMKKKKARPMIWDHFDDVPHTRWVQLSGFDRKPSRTSSLVEPFILATNVEFSSGSASRCSIIQINLIAIKYLKVASPYQPIIRSENILIRRCPVVLTAI